MAARIDRDSGRYFLKDDVRMEVDFGRTPQNRGVPPPPMEKPCRVDAARTVLTAPGRWSGVSPVPVEQAIARRESRRRFGHEPLTLDELSFLLWSTQGVRRSLGQGVTLRTVPSAGARHAFETYVVALRVAGLDIGVYRYLPSEHEIVLEFADPEADERIIEAAHGQSFAGSAAAVFIWTAIPARMEWRYGDASYKVIAMDAGHVCQNLYLSCECIGAGTCAIAAYRQDLMDSFLRLDGVDEFAIYVAPVGRVPAGR